jgi:hypothetical protein
MKLDCLQLPTGISCFEPSLPTEKSAQDSGLGLSVCTILIIPALHLFKLDFYITYVIYEVSVKNCGTDGKASDAHALANTLNLWRVSGDGYKYKPAHKVKAPTQSKYSTVLRTLSSIH